MREVRPALVPNDCTDGFGAAFWSRPEAYLKHDVQNGMSWIACLPPAVRARGTAKLAEDLAQASGTGASATSGPWTCTTAATASPSQPAGRPVRPPTGTPYGVLLDVSRTGYRKAGGWQKTSHNCGP